MRIPALLDALGQRLISDPQRRAVAFKAVNFALVGVINAAVDFSVFSFAYYYLQLPIITSNVISWLIAVTGSYIMNSMTTFAAESGRKLRLRAYAGFLLAQLAGFFANTATVFASSLILPTLIGVSTAVAVLIGKVLAIGASFLVNFTLSHFVVFRQRPTPN